MKEGKLLETTLRVIEANTYKVNISISIIN